jgi:hypothetical protein
MLGRMASGLSSYIFRFTVVLMVFVHLVINLDAQDEIKRNRLPHHIKIQYAGGIGFISVGVGWTNKKNKWEADLYYGYLPRSIGGVTIHSASAKFSWIPYHLVIKNGCRFEPLIAGLVFNYNFGKQFYGFDPENYPYKYYSFPTAINMAIFLGSRFDMNKPAWLSFYYEILGFDRDIVSLVSNPNSLHPGNILTVAIGARIRIK